jgi:hypothetical protein
MISIPNVSLNDLVRPADPTMHAVIWRNALLNVIGVTNCVSV